MKKKKSKAFLLSIITSLLILIGGTFAWARWSLDKTAMVLTIGTIDNMRIKIYPYQTRKVLSPTTTPLNYTVDDDGDSTNDNYFINIEASNNKSTSTSFAIYFKFNSIDAPLLDEGFVYQIRKSTDGGSTYQDYASGNFLNALASNRMYILEELIDPSTTYYYRVYIYIDGSSTNQATMAGSSVDMELRGSIEVKGSSYVETLYTEENQDSIYQVSHDAILAANSATESDIAATIDYRYYGSSPNNYVCLDFEGNTTCPDKHLYRIIGVIYNEYTKERQLKVIKASKINVYNSTSGSSMNSFIWDSDGSNDWNRASINSLLNSGYYNSNNDYDYYDSDLEEHYSLSFVNYGLSEKARNLISKSTYYLGSSSSSPSTVSDAYAYERGNVIITNPSDGNTRYKTWYGYIALPYASDYGYASSQTCTLLTNSGGNGCLNSNWIGTTNMALINPSISAEGEAYRVTIGLIDTHYDVSVIENIRPVMYLKGNTTIDGGLGTQANPYRVSYEPYRDTILFGSDPVLLDGLIPITFSSATGSEVKVADINKKWYQYDNEEWANAVLVSESTHTRSYYLNNPGTIIPQADILAYYVWIPRYSYKVWQYSGVSTTGQEREIEIKFVGKDTKEMATKNGEWYTHPAFTFGDTELSGIWVGKFETSHKTLSIDALNTTANNLGTCTEASCDSYSGLRILPNVRSLRYNTLSRFFYAARHMEDGTYGLTSSNTDSRVIKNSEWGAVAYLSHSKYGINKEVRLNNQNGYLTGCGAATADASGNGTCSNKYANTVTSFPQSTTGNVTGIFDMSGGAHDYVMGNYNYTTSSSGFSPLPNQKYYDYYDTNALGLCTFEYCGGHALNETYKWYSDYVSSANPWLVRGRPYEQTSNAGVFAFEGMNGANAATIGFRLILSEDTE